MFQDGLGDRPIGLLGEDWGGKTCVLIVQSGVF